MAMIPQDLCHHTMGYRDLWPRIANQPLWQQHKMSVERQRHTVHVDIGDETREGTGYV